VLPIKFRFIWLSSFREEDGVDVDENKVKYVKKTIIMLENKTKNGILIRPISLSEILGQVLPHCDQIFQEVYALSVLSYHTIR
jgi:hypothetical protein